MTNQNSTIPPVGVRELEILAIMSAIPGQDWTPDTVSRTLNNGLMPWEISSKLRNLEAKGYVYRPGHGRYRLQSTGTNPLPALVETRNGMGGVVFNAPPEIYRSKGAPKNNPCPKCGNPFMAMHLARHVAICGTKTTKAAARSPRVLLPKVGRPRAQPGGASMTNAQAWALVGGLSRPSKMPGFAYNLPAKRCILGAKLQKVAGSTCATCYAFKGWYGMSFVQKALEARFASLRVEGWVEAMIICIGRPNSARIGYFRWHDSGDLQGEWHLHNIVLIARALPAIQFWLPTREYQMVGEYLRAGESFPDNLCVRLSAHMIDGDAPFGYGLPVSTVSTKPPADDAYPCPAPFQDHKCQSCRACWTTEVVHVDYKAH